MAREQIFTDDGDGGRWHVYHYRRRRIEHGQHFTMPSGRRYVFDYATEIDGRIVFITTDGEAILPTPIMTIHRKAQP